MLDVERQVVPDARVHQHEMARHAQGGHVDPVPDGDAGALGRRAGQDAAHHPLGAQNAHPERAALEPALRGGRQEERKADDARNNDDAALARRAHAGLRTFPSDGGTPGSLCWLYEEAVKVIEPEIITSAMETGEEACSIR